MLSLSRSRWATSWETPPRSSRSLIRPAGSTPASVVVTTLVNPYARCAAATSGSVTVQSV